MNHERRQRRNIEFYKLPPNGPINNQDLIARGWELAYFKGIGKHSEPFPGTSAQILMVNSGNPLERVDNIASSRSALAEVHVDKKDIIEVLEGELIIYLGELIDATHATGINGATIDTELRSKELLISETLVLKAGDRYTINEGVGHIHGPKDSDSTVIAVFTKQNT